MYSFFDFLPCLPPLLVPPPHQLPTSGKLVLRSCITCFGQQVDTNCFLWQTLEAEWCCCADLGSVCCTVLINQKMKMAALGKEGSQTTTREGSCCCLDRLSSCLVNCIPVCCQNSKSVKSVISLFLCKWMWCRETTSGCQMHLHLLKWHQWLYILVDKSSPNC